MERIAEDFVEEISENFSELLVESFCIRYIGEFPVEEMRRAIKLTEKKERSFLENSLIIVVIVIIAEPTSPNNYN